MTAVPDYKEMYLLLFNKISDVVTDLQAIQMQTEELFMDSQAAHISLPKKETSDE